MSMVLQLEMDVGPLWEWLFEIAGGWLLLWLVVLNGEYGAAVTEALAVEEEIRLAMEMELQRIIVESDACGVVNAINESNGSGEFGMVIQGSLELLRSFRSWKMRHLKRDYNRAAHELAQLAKSSGSSQQWIGIELPVIWHVLLLDRAKC